MIPAPAPILTFTNMADEPDGDASLHVASFLRGCDREPYPRPTRIDQP